MQIRVDAVGVVQNGFKEELFDLRLQGAADTHTPIHRRTQGIHVDAD